MEKNKKTKIIMGLLIGIFLVGTIFSLTLSTRENAVSDRETADEEREQEIIANSVTMKDLVMTTDKYCDVVTPVDIRCFINFTFKDNPGIEYLASLAPNSQTKADDSDIVAKANEIIAEGIPIEKITYNEVRA